SAFGPSHGSWGVHTPSVRAIASSRSRTFSKHARSRKNVSARRRSPHPRRLLLLKAGCSTPLQKLCLRTGRRFEPELAIRVRRRNATLRGALDVPFHDQIRLIHFLEGAGFFADRDRERIQTDGTT